jgi:hypothetical protein
LPLIQQIAHLSPQSALNGLTTTPDINTVTLHNICTALITMIKEREETNKERITTYNRQPDGLAAKVLEYEASYKQALEGYTKNVHYPDLKVPAGEGFYRPVKWVKQSDNGFMLCYSQMDREHDSPYLIPIHIFPVIDSYQLPIKPLLGWFRNILTRPSVKYSTMLAEAKTLDDWGVAANCACFHSLDKQVMQADTHLHKAKDEQFVLGLECQLCEAHLEVCHVAQSLGYLKGLALPGSHNGRQLEAIDATTQYIHPIRGGVECGHSDA